MSSKIKILDHDLTELATIALASSAVRSEKINSDNLLNFTVRVKSGYGDYITENSVFELDGDYFDLAYYKGEQQADGKLMISVESEHVSYRLNNSDYDVEYFTQTGTPTEILTAILDETGFTAGAVEFTSSTTFSLQEAASRRGLLMQFAAYMGGELDFAGFTISLLAQRGSSTPKALTVGKDLTVISKAIDKRNLDDEGNPTVSYTCGVYKGAALNLGDVVTLSYSALNISTSLRIVSKAYDPYNPNKVTVEIGNYVNSLEDDLYRIETQAVKKDALMNGCRIGPEYGFECIRSDKKARSYNKSDGLAWQAGDGSGTTWVNKLFYALDTDTGDTELYFNGKFTADVIEALSAVISPNLYAEKATISELTVDRLDTSDAVQKYIHTDASDDNFQRIYDQFHELVTASTDGNDEDKVQATNRDGAPLYWTDDTHTAATTTETAYPVYTYLYTEQVKWKAFFYEYTTGQYAPAIKWGAGAPEDENLDSCLMYKVEGAFYIVMTMADGTESTISLTDFVDAKMRRVDTVEIDKTAGEISVLMEGETTPQTLTYTEDATSITYTWPDSYTTTISIS